MLKEDIFTYLNTKEIIVLTEKVKECIFYSSEKGISDIVNRRAAKKTLEHWQVQLENILLHGRQQWQLRISQLFSDVQNPAALAIYHAILLDFESVPLRNPERCKCSRLYRFEVNLHVNICLVCKKVVRVLMGSEDSKTDMISTKNQKTSGNSGQDIFSASSIIVPFAKNKISRNTKNNTSKEKIVQLQDTEKNNNNNNHNNKPKRKRKASDDAKQQVLSLSTLLRECDTQKNEMYQEKTQKKKRCRKRKISPNDTETTRQEECINDNKEDCLITAGGTETISAFPQVFNRSLVYRKYLTQFSEDSIIPESLMKLLYEEYFCIHMLNSLKARPTSVQNILIAHNLNQFVHQSVRLARHFNGEPIPMISTSLIDTLVNRFQDVAKCALTIANFGKLPSFEILTHMFLRAENRDDLASIFFLNKVSILDSSAEKLQKLIDKCVEWQIYYEEEAEENKQQDEQHPQMQCNWKGLVRIS